MATTQHKACYATMFPDAPHHPTDKPVGARLHPALIARRFHVTFFPV